MRGTGGRGRPPNGWFPRELLEPELVWESPEVDILDGIVLDRGAPMVEESAGEEWFRWRGAFSAGGLPL